MNQKSIIPISALLTFGTMTLADIQTRESLPTSREWLGFVVVFTMLSAGADLGLPIAGGFATLVLITMLLTRGPDALKFITNKFGESPRQAKKNSKNKAHPPAVENGPVLS